MLAQSLGGPMERIVMPGAQHEEIDAFFKSQALVDFPPSAPSDLSPLRLLASSVFRDFSPQTALRVDALRGFR